MTPKEKIYKQILETRNRINAFKGDEKRYNVDGCLNVGYVRNRPIKELQSELEIAQRCLYGLQIADRIKAWELTSKGKEIISTANTNIRQIQCDVENKVKETEERLNTFLAFNIGHRWQTWHLGASSVTLVYCGKDGKRLTFHDLSVYYDTNPNRERRFEVSYGSFGGFDPTMNEDRVAYLCGMAEICKAENASALKVILFGFAEWIDARRNMIVGYKDMLEHPECYDPDFFNDIKKEWL